MYFSHKRRDFIHISNLSRYIQCSSGSISISSDEQASPVAFVSVY